MATTTSKKSTKQQQQLQQQMRPLRQSQKQRANRNRAVSVVVVVAAIFGLISMLICVNAQIDGYTADVDYPAYETVPKGLSFNCQGRAPGYYADTETRCQVWHWCLHSGHQYSFLCPNGTVFNQAVRVCDWWSNVNCPGSEQLYQNNDELYRIVAAEPETEQDI